MTDKTLYPSRGKQLLLLLICATFVVVGVILINKENTLTAWACTLFFGLCLVVFVVTLLPGAAYLKLTDEGFELCSLFRKHFTPWTDIEQFGVGYSGIKKMVLMKYKPTVTSQQMARQMSAAVTNGWDGGLPDNYGMKYNELADLLNSYLASTHSK